MFLLLPFLLISYFGYSTCSEVAIRQKRQYYICGTYPNRFYSLYPCDVWTQTTRSSGFSCPNGGQKIGVGCNFNYQCTPYYNGPSQCINNCCCTVPSFTTRNPSFFTTTTTSPLSNLAYCYNGQRSQVRCTTSTDCAAGQTCVNAICCSTTGNEYTGACGGLPAISACNTGMQCGAFTCTTSNYCCECQYGRTSGLCQNGCPSGYSCNTMGYCCPFCSTGRAPFGSCFNGLCARGYTCQAGNICC